MLGNQAGDLRGPNTLVNNGSRNKYDQFHYRDSVIIALNLKKISTKNTRYLMFEG